MRLSKEQKLAEKRVMDSCQQACAGLQINIMDLGKLANFGRKHLASNSAILDFDLYKAIRDYAESIAVK